MKKLRGRAFINGAFRDDCLISIDGGTIVDVRLGARHETAESISGGVILPGFIDVHVHGGGGADFMDGTTEAVRKVTAFHGRHGTAAVAATTLSASQQDLSRAIRAIAEVHDNPAPRSAEIAGIHLEGPYLNPRKSGAQDPASVRSAEIRELDEWLQQAPHVRWMMTMAPEIDGGRALQEKFRNQVLFAIGHTEATYAQALEAVQRGARHFTHLFNAMPPLLHREPGVVGAALVSPQCTVELIADGVHVHPVVLQTFARIMPERVALVTDAIRAAGMPDGMYKLHGRDVTVSDGTARLADGRLAGSTLTMIRALQNMVELAGLPLEQVVPLATEVPARILRLEKRKGKIEIGYDADVVVVSPRFELLRVFIRGEELAAA